MAVLVTLDSLRTYGRSLDERLRDVNKYPDSFIDSRINAGYELVSTKSQPFLNEEVVDLSTYIEDGTAKFEMEMDFDVNGWKQIYVTSSNKNAITCVVKPDNIVIVNLDINSLKAEEENLITLQYYYFPNTKTGDQYFSTDILHMVENGIAEAIFDSLRDYKSRDNYRAQLNNNSKSIINGLDYDAFNVVKNNWNF